MSEYTGRRAPQPPTTHAALDGLGVLHAEREKSALDVLRRMVKWRDDVHAYRIVRSADLEALFEEARALLGAAGVEGRISRCVYPECDCEEPSIEQGCGRAPKAGVEAVHAPVPEVPNGLGEVEAIAKQMWKGEPIPGRVLRFGAAVLGMAEAALAAPKDGVKEVPDAG